MEWLYNLTEEPFYELAFILLLAAVLGALGKLLKQPLIVMFIVLGIIAGPSVLDVVHSKDKIYLLAEVGIFNEDQVLMPHRMAAENFYNSFLSKIFNNT